MSGALGVVQDSKGRGLSDYELRWILYGLYHNDGIIYGLAVTGNSNLTYHIASGDFVVTARNNGRTVVQFSESNTPAVSAGDASNPRYDSIYLLPLDPTLDNDQFGVQVGVVQGSPSVTPVAPAVPSGAFRVAVMQVKPGATNLSTGSVRVDTNRNYAVPFGGSVGKLGENWDKSSYIGDYPENNKTYKELPINNFWLPTDRMIEFRFSCCFNNEDPTKWPDSQLGVGFEFDGHLLDGSSAILRSDEAWESHEHSFITVAPAGSHSSSILCWNQFGGRQHYRYGANRYGIGAFIGRRFQIFDRGVAQ